MSTSRQSSNRRKRTLSDLDPTEFEHLVFDMLSLLGLSNVDWRTPGADGGRDIEGLWTQFDLSGYEQRTKWFVECKRYATAVDWPTVYEKVAYADSHQADVLLMCTSSSFSPAALTRVAEWNDRRRRPTIRLWPQHELHLRLQQHPDLLAKYRLSDAPATPGKSLVSIALAMSKAISSHYSRLVFSGAPTDPMLQASQNLASLLSRRVQDIETEGRIVLVLNAELPRDLENCEFVGERGQVDDPGLRAFMSYLTALSGLKLHVTVRDQTASIKNAKALQPILGRYNDAFTGIAIWADCEIRISHQRIQLRQRR
jgi:hypothetical protein